MPISREGVRQTIISHPKVRLKCEPSSLSAPQSYNTTDFPQRILKWVWYPRSHFPRNSNRGFVKTRKVWEVEQSVTSSQTKQHLLFSSRVSSKTIKPRVDEADFQALVLFLAPITKALTRSGIESPRRLCCYQAVLRCWELGREWSVVAEPK